MCLTTIGDYKNALEILNYQKKYYELTVENLFYLSECLYHLGEESKSRIYFKTAALNDIDVLNLEILQAKPIKDTILELKEIYTDEIKIKYYLPVSLILKNYLSDEIEFTKEEVNFYLKEIDRLSIGLDTEKEEIIFKIKTRILTISLILLDSFFIRVNPELQKKIKLKINEINPEILDKKININY